MDPYGYSLEGFDAIGRHRERDLGGRLIETHAKVMDGAEFDGLDGLRDYLLTKRRDAFSAPVLPQAARLLPRARGPDFR